MSNSEYRPPAETLRRMNVVYEAIRSGLPSKTACNLSGVKWKDFDWLYRNDDTVHAEVNKAQAEVIQKHLDNIAFAGSPHKVVKTTTTDRGFMATESIEFDWRASAWLLERLDRETFAQTAPDSSGSIGVVDINSLIRSIALSLQTRDATINKQQALPAEYIDVEIEERKEE